MAANFCTDNPAKQIEAGLSQQQQQCALKAGQEIYYVFILCR